MWSLSILVACIMYSHAIRRGWLRTRRLLTGRSAFVSTPLREFLKACFSYNHKKLLDSDGVMRLEFFKDFNWKEVMACNLKPPYYPSKLEIFVAKKKCKFDPLNPLLVTHSDRVITDVD